MTDGYATEVAIPISASAGATVLVLAMIMLLVIGGGLLAFAFRRTWPGVRQQRHRLRRSGGPRGADVDTFAARQIERLPVDVSSRSRRPRDREEPGDEANP